MPDNPALQTPAEPIAIVGMACRFPDAANPAEFLELILTGRRAFRSMPPVRLDVTEYGDTEPGGAGPGGLAARAIGSARAALIEGWRFDRAAYGVTQAAYQAADPAHWLALETAARALADGGFPGGQGLTRDRTGVIIGNTLTGEVSRATAMRSRWPYVRRVLRAALAAGNVSPERHAGVIEHAAAGFLAPFPEIGDVTLAGGLPGAIADRICGHFGFRGGGHAVDAAHSSSLLAIATACSGLAAGDLDAAIAGGVDISLDPHELAGLAETGALATGDMRVFDVRPTGFLPGEGCGLAVLMRAADARAAGIPAYAEIAGWGVSSAGNPALTRPGSASLLLALRRAYHRAGVDPADVQLIEGDGTGTASGDLAELTSLAEIRHASPRLAALGSVKANVGHTKAAAGAAGLIKATLAIAAGVIPPATGCVRPHPLIASEDARLRVPQAAEPWLERARLAGVSSVGPGGTSVHVILRRTRDGRRRRAPGAVQLRGGSAAQGGRPATARRAALSLPIPVMAQPPRTEAFTFAAADRQALARELSRVAELAPWLSDGELHDLACHTGRATAAPKQVRAALVASTQDQLALLAREAVALLPGLRPGNLTTVPGIAMADRGRGRVVLLFPGEGDFLPGTAAAARPGGAGSHDPALDPAIVAASLAGLRWLDELGVSATAGVGHGLGEITGLVWAGCLTEPDAARLAARRAALLAAPSAEQTALVCVDADGPAAERLCAASGLVIAAYNGPRCHVLAGPATTVRDLARSLAEDGIPARLLDSPQAWYSPAMADRVEPMRGVVREFSFQPPSRRLISTVTGAEVTAGDDVGELLCTQLTAPVAFAGALGLAMDGADLLIETGPGQTLSCLAADCSDTPAFSLAGGPADDGAAAQVAAALFASGAVPTLAPLAAARPARPIDIWRERVFIPSPCGTTPPRGTTAADRPATTDAAGSGIPGGAAPEPGATIGGSGHRHGGPQDGRQQHGGQQHGLRGPAAQRNRPAGQSSNRPGGALAGNQPGGTLADPATTATGAAATGAATADAAATGASRASASETAATADPGTTAQAGSAADAGKDGVGPAAAAQGATAQAAPHGTAAQAAAPHGTTGQAAPHGTTAQAAAPHGGTGQAAAPHGGTGQAAAPHGGTGQAAAPQGETGQAAPHGTAAQAAASQGTTAQAAPEGTSGQAAAPHGGTDQAAAPQGGAGQAAPHGTTAQAAAPRGGTDQATAPHGTTGQAAASHGGVGQAAAPQGGARLAAPQGSAGPATAGPAGTGAPGAHNAATAGAESGAPRTGAIEAATSGAALAAETPRTGTSGTGTPGAGTPGPGAHRTAVPQTGAAGPGAGTPGAGAPRTAVPGAGAAVPGAGAPRTGPSGTGSSGPGGSGPAALGTGPLGAGTCGDPRPDAPAGSTNVPAGSPGAGSAGSHSPAPDRRTQADSPSAPGEAGQPTPASPPGHRGAVVPRLRGGEASSRAEAGQRGRNGELGATPEASGRTDCDQPGDEEKGAVGERAAGERGAGEGGMGRLTTPRRRAGRIERRPRDHEQELSGAGPWIRCFTEEQRPARLPEPPETGASWRLMGGTQTSFGKIAERVFPGDPAARTVLVLVSDPAEPVACAALPGAAAEAASTGRLVVITTAAGLTGLCASLHTEHPGLGVTLIRTVATTAGLRAAERFAVATPGQFREVILDEAGVATEPAVVATDPAADGTFPLGPADVVLVTGVTRAGDLACATSLASRGAALAVLAPPGPEDPQLTACLAQLRAAGARVSRKKADLGDPGQVAAAVRSLERGLGPVTAVVHGAASGPVERFARLSEPALRSFLASQRAKFSNVARAVAMERLRVLVTFGSVAARYGRAGGGCEALASSMLAEQAWRLAGDRPRCRVLHIDWAPWAGPEPATGARPAVGGRPAAASRGLPPGTAPIPVEAGSGLLLSLLTTPDIPSRVAVHGRLGVPAPQALRPWQAAPKGAGRFLETVRVHYPGVELVIDARLSLQTDPYLGDYRIDGAAVFGAAMVLEAMAQAASALAGRPQRHLTDVSLTAPVVLPAGREQTVVRVCAVRTGDTVTTVLRCAETGFRLDHAHAVFGGQPDAAARGQAGRGQAGHGPAGDGSAGAAPADRGPASHQHGTPPGGMVDGTDLYGQIFFQAGRFRRVAFLPEASSRACRALVRGGDDQPWFGAVPGPVDTPLVLGSPGLNDATLHVLQACLPHRRLLPTGCESVTFSGREVRGALRVQAVRRPPEGGEGVWDVTAADATGQPVVSWRGVRSQGMGALARTAAWHPALLAISVESRAAEFGLDPSLRAVISCGTPLRAPDTGGRRDGDGCADTAVGHGPLDGFELTVQATRPVACRWQAVGVPRAEDVPLDEGLAALRRELEARPREALAAAQARLATIAACLAALGREPGTPLTVEGECDGGWIVVRSRDAAVACAVTEISGVPSPVAVSIASRLAQPGADGGTPPVQRGQGEPIGSLPLANLR